MIDSRLGQTLGNVHCRVVEGQFTTTGEPAVALDRQNLPHQAGESYYKSHQDSLLAYRPDPQSPWKHMKSVAEFKSVLERSTPEDRKNNIGLWSDEYRWGVLAGDGQVQNKEVTPLKDVLNGDFGTLENSATHWGQPNLAQAELVGRLEVDNVQDGSTFKCTALQIPYLCHRTNVTEVVDSKYTPHADWGLFGKKQTKITLKETHETREYTLAHPEGRVIQRQTWDMGVVG